MARSWSSVWAVILALVMVLTSEAMATARVTPTAAGLIDLCTGTGPIMVAVDANGQPVGHPHICPDYAAHAFDVGGVMAAPRAVQQTRHRLRFVTPSQSGLATPVPPPQARGPPGAI